MGRFFKKLFKNNNDRVAGKDETELINMVSAEIMAEESIAFGGGTSADTNKLPCIPDGQVTSVLNDFTGYRFYSCSDPGMVRENNQDAVFTSSFKCLAANKAISAGIGIVADGMGGLSMGEIASTAAVASVSTYMQARVSEYIENGLPHSQVILGHMNDAICNANSIVYGRGEELGEKIGTTLTCVFLLGSVAYFGHAGDSRAYLIDRQSKSIERVTRDHSLVARLIEMGQLTEESARSHPRRNEIYRMLGLRDGLEADTSYRVINKDSIIVLMSDGLWEFVDDGAILNEILISSSLSEAARKLVDMANRNGGHDNISVVIAKPFE